MKIQNSPSKPQRVLVEQESGSSVLISTPAWLSLAKKAGKNEVPLSVLEQVYARGLIEAKPHPKNSPEQQAFLRVESFLHQGKAYELDEDLVTETPKVPDGRKHMTIIKSAIKHHEERNKPEQTDKPQQIDELFSRGVLGTIERKVRTGYWTRGGLRKAKQQSKNKSESQLAQELAAKQERRERIKGMAGEIRAKRQGNQGSEQPQARQPKTQGQATTSNALRFQYKPNSDLEKRVRKAGGTAYHIIRARDTSEWEQRQKWQGKRAPEDKKRERVLSAKMQDYSQEDEKRKEKKKKQGGGGSGIG